MKDRLKEIRKSLNLTQQEFADRIKVSRNNIASYETGKSSLGDAVISLICREFNVSEDWLRNGTGEMLVEMSRSELAAQIVGQALSQDNEFVQKVFIALGKLSPDQWKVIQKFIDDELK